ncbi:MAG: hypothetical protein CVU46_16850, partial [Chloroflexi bacterium HGW-Chloroflexi-8]
MKVITLWISILFLVYLTSCNLPDSITPTSPPTQDATLLPNPTSPPPILPSATMVENTTTEPLSLSITLGQQNLNNGISLDAGGDVDTQAIQVNSSEARQSGNGTALISSDGNNVLDSYLQFNVDDDRLFKGAPTAHVQVEVDYLDQGSDT